MVEDDLCSILRSLLKPWNQGLLPLSWCVFSLGPMSASPVKGDTVMVAGPSRGRLSL